MIKDNQKYFTRLQVVLDAGVIIFSYLVAWYIMMASISNREVGVLPPEIYMLVLLVLVPFFLLLYYACNLYTPMRMQGRRLEGGNILKANIIGGLSAMAVLYLIHQMDASRMLLIVFLFLNITLTVVERNIVRMVMMNARRLGLNQKHIILVGYSRAAEEYIEEFERF